ncbi:hypothetical protein RS9916_30264 [Synechococcus sp. RS9916]|nr:hypothetical protein RS9916_30264 [Synechococcus sp. RS9916]
MPRADYSSASEGNLVSETPAKATPTPAEKPAKPPKPEDKPFDAFIQEDLLPAVRKGIVDRGITPSVLDLRQGERPVVGGSCWMLYGELPPGRRFWLCFSEPSIGADKTIALADPGTDASLLESFLIDEKRMSLALLQSRLLQRLNGQKWLGGN